MLRAFQILVGLLGFAANALASGFVERSALLIIPDEVQLRSEFLAQVEFRWDGDSPLVLTTWSHGHRLSTLGEIQIFDERGREVPIFTPVSMPLMPSGRKEVGSGEVLKIGLYLMGSPMFDRPGTYYAVATFSDAFTDGSNVRFTTKKCWFKVVDSRSKKPNQSLEPTSVLGTSAAEQPLVPSRLVAHL